MAGCLVSDILANRGKKQSVAKQWRGQGSGVAGESLQLALSSHRFQPSGTERI